MKLKNIFQLLAAILFCELAGMIGAIFTTPSIDGWYSTLAKPSFNPPNWIFGPVWTLLFALMGIALYLVLRKGWRNMRVRIAGAFFLIQLLLNVFWSVLFFGMQNVRGAFFELLALWAAILVTMILFFRVNRTAGWLFLPYLLWVSFAGVLNWAIWMG